MEILALRTYYRPEITAGVHLMDDIVDALADNNIKTVIYTPIPSRGVSKEVRKEYKNKKIELSRGDLIEIHRFTMFAENTQFVFRTIRYLFCSFVEYLKGIKEDNIDIVYCSSTPPFLGIVGTLISKKLSKKYKKKVPFIYNLQDVFPDSLINTNMTHEGSLIWKLGRKIEDYTYKNADKIIVISEGMKRNILNKGVPSDKIVVISNWIDLDSVQPVNRKDNTLITEFDIDTNIFIVVYAGNFGDVQGADIILKAAETLQDKNIEFVIFGGGARFVEAKDYVQSRHLQNIKIFDLQPQERVSEVYSLGDVALITCKPGTGNAGMPSKTWSIMACNTPIIASFDTKSDLAEVLEASNAGKCVKAGDVTALEEAILNAYSLWDKGSLPKLNLRAYVQKNASKSECTKKYVEVLKEFEGLGKNE